MSEHQQLCGGVSAAKDATPEIQKICDQVKSEAESKAEKQFSEFTAKKYTSQVVAGSNYFIKVDVGGSEHVHLRVHKNLKGEVSLHSLQLDKDADSDIAYF